MNNPPKFLVFFCLLAHNKEFEMANLRLAEVMSRATFLRFDGKVVLKYDLSNLEHREDIEKVFNYFSGMVGRMPEKSIYCLLDMTGLNESVVSVEEMSQDTAEHASYFKAAAVISHNSKSDELVKLLRNRLEIYLPIFQKEQEAIDWLLSLGSGPLGSSHA